jgi:hypothetical protein
VDTHFQRIERLPPYVFNIIGDLKQAARARGEDIIDFGMGNPDQPTPPHIVEKLRETVARGDTHRYSQSKGIPRLRKAICDWYQIATTYPWIPKARQLSRWVPRKALPTLRWRRPEWVTRFWSPTQAIPFTLTVS